MNAPYLTAAVRSVAMAGFSGASTFLSLWAVNTDSKQIVIGVSTVVLTILGARFGVEGTIDTKRTPP